MDAPAHKRRPRRPGDFNQRAKLIVDLATKQITQADIDALPPMGKEIGGQASKQAIPADVRSQNGRKGAQKRWAAG